MQVRRKPPPDTVYVIGRVITPPVTVLKYGLGLRVGVLLRGSSNFYELLSIVAAVTLKGNDLGAHNFQ